MCYTIYIEFRYERYRYLSSLFERGACNMTFTNKTIDYRVTLDTNLNLFIVFSKNDETKVATGTTIENAVHELEKLA